MHQKKLLPVSISIMLILFIACLSNHKPEEAKTDAVALVYGQPAKDSFKVRALTAIKYDRTDQRLKRGEYLANGILACFTCHSPRDWNAPGAPPIEDKKGSGGTILQQDSANLVIAPNITPD